MWGLTGPMFGAIADKIWWTYSVLIGILFFILGIYFLYTGPNYRDFFSNSYGFIIGIGLGGTAHKYSQCQLLVNIFHCQQEQLQ
jgi:lipoprotein signal peptidase